MNAQNLFIAACTLVTRHGYSQRAVRQKKSEFSIVPVLSDPKEES
jgi:hypothetical protein